MTDTMSPAEKIQFVIQQLVELRMGESNKIFCPYCQGKNRKGDVFCCDLLTKCIAAILDADRTISEVQLQEAIAEAMHSGVSN